MHVNADFSQAVNLDSRQMEWVPSPMPGVDRRMLDRIGDEVARATSIVRYAPNSAFSPHTHGGGEEFIVLEGTFVDEHGAYPKGMYVRNPVGSRHTPSSPEGCVLFVKLWQMDPADQTFVRTDLADLVWQATTTDGVVTADLHRFGDEQVTMVRFEPASAPFTFDASDGVELLVIDGAITVDGATHDCDAWLRFPPGQTVTVQGGDGATVWCKTGHLLNVRAPGD